MGPVLVTGPISIALENKKPVIFTPKMTGQQHISIIFLPFVYIVTFFNNLIIILSGICYNFYTCNRIAAIPINCSCKIENIIIFFKLTFLAETHPFFIDYLLLITYLVYLL